MGVMSELIRFRSAVWSLSSADDRERGGCWCQSRPHESECKRVRAFFKAWPMVETTNEMVPSGQIQAAASAAQDGGSVEDS